MEPIVNRPVRRPRFFELYCLLCGRGVGPGGVLHPVRRIDSTPAHCAFCRGALLRREVVDAAHEREILQLQQRNPERSAA
jgi:hypothetical protein